MKILPSYLIEIMPELEEAMEEVRLSVLDHAYELISCLDIDELTSDDIRKKLELFQIKIDSMDSSWLPNGRFYQMYPLIRCGRTRLNALSSVVKSGGQFEGLWSNEFINKTEYNYKKIQTLRHYDLKSSADGYFYISGDTARDKSTGAVVSSAITVLSSDILLNQAIPAGYTYLYVPWPRPAYPSDSSYFYNVHMLDYDRLHISTSNLGMYHIRLNSYNEKIHTIALLRNTFGYTIKEAKALTDLIPCIININPVSVQDAKDIKLAFEDLGDSITLIKLDDLPASTLYDWSWGTNTPYRMPYWFDYHYMGIEKSTPINKIKFIPESGKYYALEPDGTRSRFPLLPGENLDEAVIYELDDSCKELESSSVFFPTNLYVFSRNATTIPEKSQLFVPKKLNERYDTIDETFEYDDVSYEKVGKYKGIAGPYRYDSLCELHIKYNEALSHIKEYKPIWNTSLLMSNLLQADTENVEEYQFMKSGSSVIPSSDISYPFMFIDGHDYVKVPPRKLRFLILQSIYDSLGNKITFNPNKVVLGIHSKVVVLSNTSGEDIVCRNLKAFWSKKIEANFENSSVVTLSKNRQSRLYCKNMVLRYFSDEAKTKPIIRAVYDENHNQIDSSNLELTVDYDANIANYINLKNTGDTPVSVLSLEIEFVDELTVKTNSILHWFDYKQKNIIAETSIYDLDKSGNSVIKDNTPKISEVTHTDSNKPPIGKLNPFYVAYTSNSDPYLGIIASGKRTSELKLYDVNGNEITFDPTQSYIVTSILYNLNGVDTVVPIEERFWGLSNETSIYIEVDPSSRMGYLNLNNSSIIPNNARLVYVTYTKSAIHKLWTSDNGWVDYEGLHHQRLFNYANSSAILFATENNMDVTANLIKIDYGEFESIFGHREKKFVFSTGVDNNGDKYYYLEVISETNLIVEYFYLTLNINPNGIMLYLSPYKGDVILDNNDSSLVYNEDSVTTSLPTEYFDVYVNNVALDSQNNTVDASDIVFNAQNNTVKYVPNIS